MAQGIILGRGNWETRTFPKSQLTTSSQGQFQKGDLVCLDHGRHLSLYTSTQSNYLGVALHDSLQSALGLSIGIPAPGCTAYVDSLTTDTASNFSLGQSGSVITRYGRTSCISMQPGGGSSFSFMWTVIGPLDSVQSRVEVAFLQQNATWYSASSATLNN